MALDALVLEQAPEVDDPSTRPPKRLRLWIALIFGIALVGSALGVVAHDEVRTNTQFDRTHRSLDLSRHHLRTTLASLATVRQELDGVDVQVFLTDRELAQDAADLKSAQATLATARSDVSHQTTVISDLQTCLGGVQEALNALAVADQARAISALHSVSSSCSSVVATGG